MVNQQLPHPCDLGVSSDEPSGRNRQVRHFRVDALVAAGTALSPSGRGATETRCRATDGHLDRRRRPWRPLGQLLSTEPGHHARRRRRAPPCSPPARNSRRLVPLPHPSATRIRTRSTGPGHTGIGEPILEPPGRCDRIRRCSTERRSETIATRRKHVPAFGLDRPAHDGVVNHKGLRHRVRIARPQTCRTLDIGEQERRRARRPHTPTARQPHKTILSPSDDTDGNAPARDASAARLGKRNTQSVTRGRATARHGAIDVSVPHNRRTGRHAVADLSRQNSAPAPSDSFGAGPAWFVESTSPLPSIRRPCDGRQHGVGAVRRRGGRSDGPDRTGVRCRTAPSPRSSRRGTGPRGRCR